MYLQMYVFNSQILSCGKSERLFRINGLNRLNRYIFEGTIMCKCEECFNNPFPL